MHRVCLRASMLLASALLGLALLGDRSARAASDGPVRITFFIWAGSNQGVVPREVFKAYREAHPEVTIEELESTNAITYPKMVAARRTTPDNPLVSCGFFNVDAITRGDADEMWESMNPERIPNLANVLPQYLRPDNRGVGYQMSGIGILYNKNAVKTPPTSWTALWDPANRGRVVMFDYNTQMLSIAARLNGGSEHDIDPGFKIWSDNAQNLRALFDSNDALKNALASGDAWMAPWFSSISHVWIAEGAPFAYAVPKEGAIGFPLFLSIARGIDANQRRVCEDLVNTLLAPANAGRYALLTANIPTAKNAAMSSEQLADPTLNMELAQNAIVLDYPYIGQMTAEWRKRWDREVKFKLR
jgi:putative spermidine/putrescine transport system substrate-binding protein